MSIVFISFVSEIKFRHLAAGLPLQVSHVGSPYPGGRRAVADQRRHDQLRIRALQEKPQGAGLAGRAAEQHPSVLFQTGLYAAVGSLQIALDIFGLLQRLQLLLVPGLPVRHFHALPERGSVDHPLPPEHVFRQDGEHAPGGAGLPQRLILDPGSEIEVFALLRLRRLDGADLQTLSAGDAFLFVNLRIPEALFLHDHANRAHRADIRARAAAAARLFFLI